MNVLVFTVLTAVAGVHSELHLKRTPSLPEGYIVNSSANKAYKIMYQAQKWERARDKCEQIGGFLAVPKSQAEFKFLQKLVRGMSYQQVTDTQYKLLVWLGISNLDEYTVWRNIYGEDINETGFNQWSNGHIRYSDDPKEPHCAGMDAMNRGLRDYWCHRRQPYICEIQVTTQALADYNNMNDAIECKTDMCTHIF